MHVQTEHHRGQCRDETGQFGQWPVESGHERERARRGWPFAILLMLDTQCGDRAPLCGIVVKEDQRRKALVLERDGIVYPVQVNAATTICGTDGYPVSIDDVYVGDHVEIT